MAKQYNIFVSKPNSLTVNQAGFYSKFLEFMKVRSLVPRTLGETDFPNNAPIYAVRELLNDCDGAIILGLSQIYIENGVSKSQTEKETLIQDMHLPTAWNQIEAGMAFMCDIPILIICEDGVSGGVFDIGNTDRFIHKTDLNHEWISSPKFTQPFNQWYNEILFNQKEK